jgi:hypothetical protein
VTGRGHLPQRDLHLPPVGAVLGDIHDEWCAGDRRYLSEGSMATLYPERDTGSIAELNPGD